jgi:hypothetical protein
MLSDVATVRRCRVTVKDTDGITHTVEAQGSTLFEVAAAAIAMFRTEEWLDALTPNTVLQIEVQLPPIIHQVPLQAPGAVGSWAEGGAEGCYGEKAH